MKNIKLNIVFILFAFAAVTLYSQEKCKVLKADINIEYSGECKKGLAHGKGYAKGENEYEGNFKKGLPNGDGNMIYADGSKYIGEWKNGFRNGTGKYIFNIDGKDTISDGIWKNDKYMGKKKVKGYKVVRQESVPRYMIRKVSDVGNDVTITLKNNGRVLSPPSNISASGGNQINFREKVSFENINYYPFTCNMRYTVSSKLGTGRYIAVFEFEILEPGKWLVELQH